MPDTCSPSEKLEASATTRKHLQSQREGYRRRRPVASQIGFVEIGKLFSIKGQLNGQPLLSLQWEMNGTSLVWCGEQHIPSHGQSTSDSYCMNNVRPDFDTTLEVVQNLDALLIPLGFRKHGKGVLPDAQYNKDYEDSDCRFGVCVELEILLPPKQRSIGIELLPENYMDDPPVSMRVAVFMRQSSFVVPILDNTQHSKALGHETSVIAIVHLVENLAKMEDFWKFVKSSGIDKGANHTMLVLDVLSKVKI